MCIIIYINRYWFDCSYESPIWPGKSMNNESDGWKSYILLNTSHAKIVFNNGGDFDKTPDLTVDVYIYYYKIELRRVLVNRWKIKY